jgi:hypothetical protein
MPKTSAEWLEERKNLTAEQAIDDLMISSCLDPVGTPIEKLHKLLTWETTIALDPQVSKAAHELYRKGFDEGYQAIVKFFKATSPETAGLLEDLYKLAEAVATL